jgi:hypothetical protein
MWRQSFRFFIFKPQTHRKLEFLFSQELVVLRNLWCIGGFSMGGSRLVRPDIA